MWSASRSIKLSGILVKILFVVLAAAVFIIPWLTGYYDSVSLKEPVQLPLCITLYASLFPAFLVLVRLDNLLENIKNEEVFIKKNCENLRVMSYCCFAVAVIFFGFGFFRPLSFLISFAAGFMGVILRVLKNVFVEAIALREENDSVI